jgi:hypothetical protein
MPGIRRARLRPEPGRAPAFGRRFAESGGPPFLAGEIHALLDLVDRLVDERDARRGIRFHVASRPSRR